MQWRTAFAPQRTILSTKIHERLRYYVNPMSNTEEFEAKLGIEFFWSHNPLSSKISSLRLCVFYVCACAQIRSHQCSLTRRLDCGSVTHIFVSFSTLFCLTMGKITLTGSFHLQRFLFKSKWNSGRKGKFITAELAESSHMLYNITYP